MTTKRNNRRKGKGKKGPNPNPDANSIVYKGPIWKAPKSRENLATISTNMIYSALLVSNASSVINAVFDTSMTALVDWANFAGLYDEFRMLAFELEYFPSNRYSKVTTLCTPGVGVVDHDDNLPLGSFLLGVAYESARMLSIEDPWTDRSEYRGSSVPSLKWHMSGAEEAGWLTTAAPNAGLGSIKLFFDNLSASTTYGRVIQRCLVQFRGRD